jgi:sulfur carrier protein ThiS
MARMKVTVKLFGLLSRPGPAGYPDRGLAVEIPDGSRVGDLLAHLKISTTRGTTVIKDGRLMSVEETLTEGALVQVFQAMYGG